MENIKSEFAKFVGTILGREWFESQQLDKTIPSKAPPVPELPQDPNPAESQ